jgi:hexaprenyl-diphosphate synthase
LNTISSSYFSKKGKHIRPLVVLLMSLATNKTSNSLLQESLINTGFSTNAIQFQPNDASYFKENGILPQQRRLAEITEMIHTASLLHDDVIDMSLTRRSEPTINAEYGNKMAILAGDFLLARASVALARLRNVEVVELMSTVISNLVEGEMMQRKPCAFLIK